MKLSDFDFHLPSELIAYHGTKKRDQSRLLTENERGYQIELFTNIINHLKPGDLMVFNNSKVIKSKLLLKRDEKIIASINLNKPIMSKVADGMVDNIDNHSGSNYIWHAFAKPAKKLSICDEFYFDNNIIKIIDKLDAGQIIVEFILDDGLKVESDINNKIKNNTNNTNNKNNIFDFLQKYGSIPLPPYIKRESEEDDDDRYQTIYAKDEGSVAAPTAGLHFTQELLDKIKANNVNIAFVTLHVGAGTFLPVKHEDISKHMMHSEFGYISDHTANLINETKEKGGRVISVGTTSLRLIESCAKNGRVHAQNIDTDIFITPGYKFQIIDALVTNFHLPKSTLLMLISAFYGVEKTKEIYKFAIENKMRFFSYGDAMFINLL